MAGSVLKYGSPSVTMMQKRFPDSPAVASATLSAIGTHRSPPPDRDPLRPVPDVDRRDRVRRRVDPGKAGALVVDHEQVSAVVGQLVGQVAVVIS